MKGKLLAAIAIIAIVLAALAYFLWPRPPQIYVPGSSFDISRYNLEVKDNQLSSEIVTITVTKNDDKNVPTTFVIKLESSNPNNMIPISVNTNQPLYEYTTKQLIDQGSSDSLQFKIRATLPEGTTFATYNLKATLYYNDTKTPDSPLSLNVNVRQ